jgi:hypothetical protein
MILKNKICVVFNLTHWSLYRDEIEERRVGQGRAGRDRGWIGCGHGEQGARRAGLQRASGLRRAAHRVQAVLSMGERGVWKGELGSRVTGSMAQRRDL